ncbi:Hydroxyethylthiazole kinase family-domain-containing protein [Lophiotrema nucula]|uniref:Hydroxyethylthiazole kinase family-domain-containing protein n=1 Tax=Lophiotrema nucula TaxID=690887 RepID=A0A6A5YL38_9PLEO|nr:Hydroxyethylthiazole kinase family-domain-containing protein [Lophiotrema nucula]
MATKVDYSLYLVTDSTEAILGSKDLVQVVEQALKGGVTIVQYRDKKSDTGFFIETGKRLHQVCQKYNIPLLINDRVDVALAVGCEGVHLGQDDMDITSARQLLGKTKIIGATVSSTQEAEIAVKAGADYLGIGTLYATSTKKDTKSIIGINGIRQILRYLGYQEDQKFKDVKTVCIGGINASNLQRIIFQLSGSCSPRAINGVAIVSAIMAAQDPESASSNLKSLLNSPPPWKAKSTEPHFWHEKEADEFTHIKTQTLKAIRAVASTSPLSHNMTNLVVQNISANIALAIGASPIMSNNGAEAADLAKLGGGLVINMGTATPDALANHRKAVEAYNAAGGPIVLDPVGAGATSARKAALAFLLASGYFDLIKGNEREILSVARACGFTISDASQQRGVDSGTALYTTPQKCRIVSRLAACERNIILMTGATDIISDGVRTYTISNGSHYLGLITGSGCSLGTTLAAYMAANPGDKLLAAVAGILHYEIAAEYAAKRQDVQGPGTFVPAFIDELYNRRVEGDGSDPAWIHELKVGTVKEVPDAGVLKDV